jgi:hypothetical protein
VGFQVFDVTQPSENRYRLKIGPVASRLRQLDSRTRQKRDGSACSKDFGGALEVAQQAHQLRIEERNMPPVGVVGELDD